MAPAEIGQLIANVGPAVAALIVIIHWTAKRIEKTEEMAVERETRLVNRLQALEDQFRNELVVLVKEQGEILVSNSDALRENSQALKTVSEVVVKLDSSIFGSGKKVTKGS